MKPILTNVSVSDVQHLSFRHVKSAIGEPITKTKTQLHNLNVLADREVVRNVPTEN